MVLLLRPSSVAICVQWGQYRPIHHIGDSVSKRNQARRASIQRPGTSAPASRSRGEESSSQVSLPGPEATAADPVASAALAVLGLADMPVDRKQLDLQVSHLAGAGWTWEMTAAWRHLWQLLPPKSSALEQGGEDVADGRVEKPVPRRP